MAKGPLEDVGGEGEARVGWMGEDAPFASVSNVSPWQESAQAVGRRARATAVVSELH
jgi:hypothetical protein